MNLHGLTILGLGLAVLGALAFMWGAGVMVLANRTYKGPTESQHRHEKLAHLVGAALLLAGFALQLLVALVR